MRDGVRVNAETGEPFEVENVLRSPTSIPHSLAYSDRLTQLGIAVSMRSPFTTEYQRLVGVERDFDMTLSVIGLALVPGAELRNLWGSEAADRKYSANTAGIKSPAIDFLIAKVIDARSRAELVTAARALDRVVSWGHYYISIGHLQGSFYVYWNIFGRPEKQPRFSTGFPSTWWIDSAKWQTVASGRPIEVEQAARH